MNATILHIIDKARTNETDFVDVTDFITETGPTVPAQTILDNPAITLYCLDHAQRRAIFVETSPNIDLTRAPFFYQAQFDHAQQLIAVEYDTLHALASALGPFPPLILLHSVGRCGSTLLSQVFDSVPNVVSLSEPDFFTNILLLREQDGRLDDELAQLLQSGLRLLLKPLPQRQATTWAIKFRSSSFEISDLLYRVCPAAKNIFLYRNAVARTRSEARAFNLFTAKPVKMHDQLLQRWTRLIPLLAHYRRQAKWGRLSRIEMSVLAWLSRMDRYLSLHAQGVPLRAVRYEDMIKHPEEVVSALFDFCDILPDFVQPTLRVFSRDSQAGTTLSRFSIQTNKPNDLTDKHLRQMHKILRRHPQVKTADFVLPHTVTPVPARSQ